MTTIYDPFSVVDVPFPFIDSPRQKQRPALVLSTLEFQKANRATVLAMITSAGRSAWAHDVALIDWQIAGLGKPCIVRWKIFTLDSTLVTRVRGHLTGHDKQEVTRELSRLLPLSGD